MATLEGAKAAYLRGTALERAKDYKGAIAQYHQALAEDARYAYANKQMGNCYYYLGDKVQALANYDIWLNVKKDDEATRAFAERLRAEIAPPAPRPSPEPSLAEDESEPEPEPEERPRRRRRVRNRVAPPPSTGPLGGSSFFMGYSMAYLFGNSNDFKKVYANSNVDGLTFSDMGLNFQLRLGYLFSPGIGVEAGALMLSRIVQANYVYKYSSSSYYYSDYDMYSILETTYYVEPFYRLPLGRVVGLIGGVQLGYATATFRDISYSSSYSSNGISTFNGSGSLIAPNLRLQFLFGGRFSLELAGQYRMSEIGPFKNSAGTTLKYYNATGGTEEWYAGNSGFTLGIGFNIYFSRLTAQKKLSQEIP